MRNEFSEKHQWQALFHFFDRIYMINKIAFSNSESGCFLERRTGCPTCPLNHRRMQSAIRLCLLDKAPVFWKATRGERKGATKAGDAARRG
jgi:hypothetical protein